MSFLADVFQAPVDPGMDRYTTLIGLLLIFTYPLWVTFKALDKTYADMHNGMGLVEHLLTKVLPYTDIKRQGTDDLYLRRFFLYPRNKDFSQNVGKRRWYLHKFYRGDEDLHMHSHPWSFTSFILTKGYWEETSDKDGNLPGGEHKAFTLGPNWEKRTQKWFSPGSVIRRPASWVHRVVLDNNEPVWTLVHTGVKERTWGFVIEGQECPWRRYDGSLGICEDGMPRANEQGTDQSYT